MTWRNHKDHKEETAAVKAALVKAGIPFRKVGHGRGTAWGWLEVYTGENPSGLPHDIEPGRDRCHPYYCQACKANSALAERIQDILREVTGRTGEYDGRTLILHQ